MDNNELLEKLLTAASKFLNTQYDHGIFVGETSYRNFDLLAVYKINELYKSKRIGEIERNRLLDLYYQKIVLEEKLDNSETEEEQDAIEERLKVICEELVDYDLNIELSIEYLISSMINHEDNIRCIDTNLVASIIYISDKLREKYDLSVLQTAEHINFYGHIIPLKEDDEGLEYVLHKDVRIWAKRIKDRARVLELNDK